MELQKEFEINDIAYNETTLGAEILLDGAGKYTIVAKEDLDIAEIHEAIMAILPLAFQLFGYEGVSYNVVAHDPVLFTNVMNEILKKSLEDEESESVGFEEIGFEIKEIFFTALYPDEDSIKRLIAARKKPATTNTKRTVASNTATQNRASANPETKSTATAKTEVKPKVSSAQNQTQSSANQVQTQYPDNQAQTQTPDNQVRLQEDAPQAFFCPFCGANISSNPNAKFCTKCGSKLPRKKLNASVNAVNEYLKSGFQKLTNNNQ